MSASTNTNRIRVAVLGATGYTGVELVRLLSGHPHVQISLLGGHGKAGEPVARVLPSLAGLYAGTIEAFDADLTASRADAVFCALPHGASAPIVAALRERGLVTFDLSADFRLHDLDEHARWYGPHAHAELAAHAVYGLCELRREAIRGADLIAVPGCYPTAANLALAPLVKGNVIALDGIVVDAKSGVSGAGRSPSATTHFAETSEGLRAYKVAGQHRHTAEIEQEMSRLAGREIRVTFTPHLVPMTRGILATIYARANDASLDAEHCTRLARDLHEGSPSVHVHEPGTNPDTLWVRGSNRAHLSYAIDPRTRTVVAQAVIDNLVKGAAGQAIQCFNLRFGFDEGEALRMPATFP